jgi:hypothetical protein
MVLPVSVPVTFAVPPPEITIMPDRLLPDCCHMSLNVPLVADGAVAIYIPDQVPESGLDSPAPVDWLALVVGVIEPFALRVVGVGTVTEVFDEALLQPVIATKRTTNDPIVAQPPIFRLT